MSNLQFIFDPKTVLDIVHHYDGGHLNLNPGFQRSSVWSLSDRKKLIDTIVRNYPLPSIFLYRRNVNGKTVYDVIDGKQRIESILMFVGKIRGKKFSVKLQFPNDENVDVYNWRKICKKGNQHLLEAYRIHAIEVSGEPADIIDLFIRINSTGKALSPAEKRHARYFDSELLKTASRIAHRFEDYFRDNKILSAGKISRMKHVELVCELMISINQGDVINKKMALDKVMESRSISLPQAKKLKEKTIKTLNRLKRMFPKIYTSRFHQISDFYSLAVLISQFENEKLVLADSKRNKIAWKVLLKLSNEVDRVSELQKKVKGSQKGMELSREYLLTVMRSTDDISQRRKRGEILRGILQSIFEKKDADRLFSQEQRRILWNSTNQPKCEECGKVLTWADFTVDHIKPYSKGGKTNLSNAALLCRKHNASKGNRRKLKKRK